MELNQLIDQVLDECNYRNNPYFANLASGQFDKDDFVETQVQFYFAVIFFSRPMAALAAKIPRADLRMEVVRNVWEEHGEGEASKIHGQTFETFLERINGITLSEVDKRSLWPEIRAFNTTLVGACVLDEYMIGAGLMGMIERMFADISAWIGQSVVKQGWLTNETLIHYNLHQELDIKHSMDFFDVLRPAWDESMEHRYYIEQGMRLGAYTFNSLYLGLWEARKRRHMRDVRTPHTRA